MAKWHCWRSLANNSGSLVGRESFLGFWDSPKSDAGSLLAVVEQVFDEVGLTFEMLRGQCYDGVANMTGCHAGLGVRILEKQPMAPFVHCWSHQANLVLLHACSPVKDIRNTLNKIQTAYKFFSSHKRQDVLRDMQSQNEVDIGSITEIALRYTLEQLVGCGSRPPCYIG